MRQKTHYDSRPEDFTIFHPVRGEVTVRFRSNIEEVAREDGEPEFICDEYKLILPNRPLLAENIRNRFDDYIRLAKTDDIAKEAANIRATRNRLLQESDAQVAVDRLNLFIPESITATSMLSAVKAVFTALREATTGPWAIYRQALRDIPQQPGFPYEVEFPKKPE